MSGFAEADFEKFVFQKKTENVRNIGEKARKLNLPAQDFWGFFIILKFYSN